MFDLTTVLICVLSLEAVRRPDGRPGDRDHGVPGGVIQIFKSQPILMKIYYVVPNYGPNMHAKF